MIIKNAAKIDDLIRKYPKSDYQHCFIIERPEWDKQNIYNDVFHTVESESFHGGYTKAGILISNNELKSFITILKSRFDLPVKHWKKVLVEYE